MTMADESGVADAGRGPQGGVSTLVFILVVVALTLVAAGAGFFGGLQILAGAEQNTRTQEDKSRVLLGGLQHMSAANVTVLPPIVTNLSGKPPVWIRLESSLVFHDEAPDDADALAATIAKDIVAYLRTVEVKQIEGAIGFQHLSEDLNDRVRVRTGGRAGELIIQGLIVE